MNEVVLMGRLARDPELRYTQSGSAVASFTVAVDREFSKDQEVDFINCIAWQKAGEHVAQYYKKGNRILLKGRIQVRTYEGNDGQKRWATEVVVNRTEFVENKQNSSSGSDNMEGEYVEFDDDTLPF